MAKYTRQDSRKKRDKRRLLRQQASASRHAWQDLDVSGWFDNTVGMEADILEVFYPQADDLPSPVYDTALPGDACFSYYAYTHPDRKDETEAVVLVKQLMLSRKKNGQEEDPGKEKAKPLLDKLKKMAQAGSVTASACLGYLYINGELVRRDLRRAKQYLQFAADSNDPVACFWLSSLSEGAEEKRLIQKSCEGGCPSALYARLRAISRGETAATSSEIDMLAENLAALAVRGSMKCMLGLLAFLGSQYGEGLRSEFAPAMLGLLDRLAAENYGQAIHYEAVVYSQGILRPADAEKASQLYLKAYEMGEEHAGMLYAMHVLASVSCENIPRKEKTAKVQPARKMLEELHDSGTDMPRSAGVLGCLLVMSGDDDDFRKGIACLEEALAGGDLDTCLRATSNILMWSDDPERHKLCIRLLNSLVRKKDAAAISMRGRYYLDGGLCGNQNVAKGMEMLEQAAEMGSGWACYKLAEVYLFGLYNIEPDTEKAAAFLKKGGRLRSGDCRVLLSLMQLGEFQECPASVDSRTAGAVLRAIRDNFNRDDSYLLVTYAIARFAADSPFRKYGMGNEFLLKKLSKQEEYETTQNFAKDGNEFLLAGELGPLCYMAYALEKLAETKAAGTYAASLAEHMHLPEGSSCEDIADYLYDYVDSVPKSYVQYRLKYGRNDVAEDRPLY